MSGFSAPWVTPVKTEEKPAVENTSGLEAVGRAVLVKPYEVEAKAGGVIALPDSVRGTMSIVEQRAVVIHLGASCWHDEPSPRAKIGDHVLLTRYAGFIAGPGMTADGQEYRFVTDRDIFGKITRGDENG